MPLTAHMRSTWLANSAIEKAIEQVKTVNSQIQKQETALPERVVRKRVAVIREEPKSGSAVVTKIFPNQVVTVLDENSKWIRIQDYGFIQEKFYEEWTLKKYFPRVGRSPGNASRRTKSPQ